MWINATPLICKDYLCRWIRFRPGSWSFGIDIEWHGNEIGNRDTDWIGTASVVLRLIPTIELGVELNVYSSRVAARRERQRGIDMEKQSKVLGRFGTVN